MVYKIIGYSNSVIEALLSKKYTIGNLKFILDPRIDLYYTERIASNRNKDSDTLNFLGLGVVYDFKIIILNEVNFSINPAVEACFSI